MQTIEQDFLQQVKSSLAQNHNLTEEFKESLYNLIFSIYEQIHSLYRIQLPKPYLIEKLKTFAIEEVSQLMQPFPYTYNGIQNKVTIQPDKIIDPQHLFCQTVLEMAVVKEPNHGIDNPNYMAIKKGILEACASYLVGNYGISGLYEDEQVVVRLMDVITEGKIVESFLKGNELGVKETIQEYRLQNIIAYANFNYTQRNFARDKNTTRSFLGNIESLLINHFYNLPMEIVKKQVDVFEANLICEPNVMGDPTLYSNLREVYPNYIKRKQQAYMSQGQNLKMEQMYQSSIPIPVYQTPFVEQAQVLSFEEEKGMRQIS